MSHHPERTARNVRPVNQPPSFWNYFRSGKWQFGGDNQFAHPGQWNEYEVPVNSLRLPNATDEAQCGWRVIKYIKWLFGQKIYEGPPQIPIQQ